MIHWISKLNSQALGFPAQKPEDLTEYDKAVITVLQEYGALCSDELAVKLDRAGENIDSEVEQLVARKLVREREFLLEDRQEKIYLPGSGARIRA
jgi:hypothetical protein